MWQTLRELNEREAHWNTERSRQEQFLQRIQDELVRMQARLGAVDTREEAGRQWLSTYLESLENQVALVQLLVGAVVPSLSAAPATASATESTGEPPTGGRLRDGS
jgi:hypothetical protein